MTKLFARMHIRYMYFHGWSRYSAQSIVQGHAGVCVGTGIEHDAINFEATGVDAVDEISLMVTLVVIQLHVRVLCAQFGKVIFEAATTVDTRLAATQ